ncbi:hypothetical protein VOLCADRAFT_96426 [Volvox carteri f. nagariensis]|uniref:Glycosyl transferase CAP10 domain-containing protein n=1 Tax=Volvox carteri f. nagariensis TaxID=3068 RepID=D8UA27_VOLCA|nr:uncharacterized protein VOLCADRAFT_96426 [Volvox carteri f. nagariensis]EFJ43354.1 hypothetical protein VOLCADRAFT_96426 [Volvox carteri f. nagariensis]|eukprot:XP_002955501.1 hypothetical protein VOLCADRAFT_96426 [Volvox carteri f. nagariensis]
MTAYHACLNERSGVMRYFCGTRRYPVKYRIPQVVWRGSSTGKVERPVSLETCMKLKRVRLHLLAREHPDLLDVKLNRLNQECKGILGPIVNDTGGYIHPEDYNKYCVILDVDGNTWSDRFASRLVHSSTPILKLASNYTSHVDHFFAPGVTLEEFDGSLSTVVETARRMVEDCKQNAEFSRGQALARQSQETARELLDHIGVVRSMAYGLVQYQRLLDFPFNSSLEGFQKVDRECCSYMNFPVEFAEELKSAL